MMMRASSQSIAQDLVLIGGGHSHAIALKQFGMNPIPGVRLTLITNVSHTPYSGMLPGYVAGLYDYDECHIDLRPLANYAGAQMVVDRAIGLDLKNNRVICAHHPAIAFDQLSIDIGSTPATSPVPGSQEYAIPVKPIAQFLEYWDRLVEEVRQHPERSLRVGIVGGGAGGVELALSAQAHLSRIYRAAGQPETQLTLHLFHRGDRLLPGRNAWIGKRSQQILVDRGVQVHLNETVKAIQPNWVCCESGLEVACDRIFWVTQAAAAPWLQDAGLAVDDKGFILVEDTLQSVSHPHIFAAGDVATLKNHPRPKAGVFAVREGKPLFQNLCRALQGQPLKPFVPQQHYLILVGTGTGAALASRGFFHLGPHPLIWQWKDRIDRQFMEKFSDLQSMSSAPSPVTSPSTLKPQAATLKPQAATLKPAQPSTLNAQTRSAMPCAGCGSKVGSTVLGRVLSRVKQEYPTLEREDILIGLDVPDDAAVVTVPVGQAMVQTVDYFRALLNDPFLLGQISVNHCLSDLYAMGAEPQSALAIATLPYATAAKLEETLYQLLSGAIKALNAAQAALIGGHTVEGAELAFGLSCNGLVQPDQIWRKGDMQPGEALILTKPLGTGMLFAADMQLKAKGRWIEGAIASMLQANREAAICFRRHQASACTDVTGFGLLGHLLEMMRASQVGVELKLEQLPVLDGAIATLEQGILSSLHSQNLEAAQWMVEPDKAASHPLYPLLFDPQTSGGLLATVPLDQVNACLQSLNAAGYPQACVVGHTLPPNNPQPLVRIK